VEQLLGLLVLGMATGFVYGLIAIGFVMIYKSSGILNLATGELTILGAYVFYGVASQLGFGIYWALVCVLVCALLLGVLIERVLLRPLAGQPILATIIMTLALGGLLRGIMALAWGNQTMYAPEILPGLRSATIAGFGISSIHLIFIIASLILVALLANFYRYTTLGLSMRAVSEDIIVARSLGIKTNNVLALVWGIAGVVSMVGGVLLTNVMGIHYTLVDLGFKSMAVVLVGGLESLPGVLIMGPAMGIIEVLGTRYINPLVGGEVEVVLPWVILMGVLFFRPYGLFGWERIERV